MIPGEPSPMKGRMLVSALKDVLCKDGRAASDSELAKALNYTAANVSVLASKDATPIVVGNIIRRAVRAAESGLARDWIRTLVEFYPVRKTDSRQGARYEILDQNDERQKPLYRLLRETKTGLYSFYNSEGSIIYLGMTKNNLWGEINNAFNRDMAAHKIWIVAHPQSRAFTRRTRPIRRTNVHLYDTATFFSAYQVHKNFIDGVETLFIRMLPNNLTNVRIEGQTERSVERPNVTTRGKKKST